MLIIILLVIILIKILKRNIGMDISNIERNIIEVYRDTLIGTRDIIEQIEKVHIEYNAIGLRQYVVLAWA